MGRGVLKGSVMPLGKFPIGACLGFPHTPLLVRWAIDERLCCDRVIMHVVNKHACVRMCAVTAMSSIQ